MPEPPRVRRQGRRAAATGTVLTAPRGNAQIGQFGTALPVALIGPIKRQIGGSARCTSDEDRLRRVR